MLTVKVNLEKGLQYVGERGYGKLQKDLTEVVRKLISGEIEIQPKEELAQSTITFRLEPQFMDELKEIAEKNNISVNYLLNIGMKQSNLIVSTIN